MSAPIERFAALLGSPNVLTAAAAPFPTDGTGAYRGDADAVLRPSAAQDVASILRIAREAGLAVTPQSGSASVAGGGVPDERRGIVLVLTRLKRTRGIDSAARASTVAAGMVLQSAQEPVAEHGLDFALILARAVPRRSAEASPPTRAARVSCAMATPAISASELRRFCPMVRICMASLGCGKTIRGMT